MTDEKFQSICKIPSSLNMWSINWLLKKFLKFKKDIPEKNRWYLEIMIDTLLYEKEYRKTGGPRG